MNYTEWNDLIADFIFNNEQNENEVFLYLTKQDVLRLHASYLKDGDNTYIWKDFINAINAPVFKYEQNSFIERAIEYYRRSRQQQFQHEYKYPPYIAFLVALVMPLSELETDGKIRENNYYNRAKQFFKENKIIFEEEDLCTNGLMRISLDERNNGYVDLWKDLEIKSNSRFKRPQLLVGGRNEYVRTIWIQSVLTADERRRFKLLFVEANLPPNMSLSDDEIWAYIEKYACKLIYSNKQNRWEFVKTSYHESLIYQFKEQYQNWDGKTDIEERSQSDKAIRIQREDRGTIYNLYLSLAFDEREKAVNLRYNVWYKNYQESPEEINLYKDNEFICSVYLKSDGWGNRFIEKEVSLSEPLLLRDLDNGIKAIFKPSEFYIFQRHPNGVWTSKFTYEKGLKYYLLVSRQKINSDIQTSRWLESNAISIKDYCVSKEFELYKIEKAESPCPALNLIFLSEVSIFDNLNIVLSRDMMTTSYLNLFTLRFNIMGLDFLNSKLYAQYEFGYKIELEYDESTNTWNYEKRLMDHAYDGKLFKIIAVNNKEEIIWISNKSYTYTIPSLPNSYMDSFRNNCGEPCLMEDSISNQLELNVNITQINPDFFLKNKPLDLTFNQYKGTDYILYGLSSKSQISKLDFYNILDAFETNITIDNYYRADLLNNYDRLGFINYDYFNGKHVVTINKPTLILLPLNFNKVDQEVPVIYQTEDSYYTAILVGARTPDLIRDIETGAPRFDIFIQYHSSENLLLPQPITLHAKRVNNFIQFAKDHDIAFSQKVYAADLFKQIKSVDEYFESILKEENIIDEYPSCYKKYESFNCLDYSMLSRKRFYDPSLDLVTYNPGTYKENTILWYEGKQYPVDKYWGHFIIMSQLGIKHVQYDTKKRLVKIPLHLRLPKAYARVCALISYKQPFRDGNFRCYYITFSPLTEEINPENILRKLNQI